MPRNITKILFAQFAYVGKVPVMSHTYAVWGVYIEWLRFVETTCTCSRITNMADSHIPAESPEDGVHQKLR